MLLQHTRPLVLGMPPTHGPYTRAYGPLSCSGIFIDLFVASPTISNAKCVCRHFVGRQVFRFLIEYTCANKFVPFIRYLLKINKIFMAGTRCDTCLVVFLDGEQKHKFVTDWVTLILPTILHCTFRKD